MIYRDVFLNITLLKSWYDPAKFTFNGVTWFLSCILFIYLCVPFVIHFFRLYKIGGTAVFSFLILLLLKMAFDTFGYKMGMNPWPGVFGWYCNPVYRLFDFLLGYNRIPGFRENSSKIILLEDICYPMCYFSILFCCISFI